MDSRSRVLVAAQPAAWKRLQPMLAPFADTVIVETIDEALRTLERNGFHLILSTIAFDGSRMMDFLQAVKRTPSISAIPFVCVRVLRTVLSDKFVESTGAACEQSGAAAFVDIAKFDHDKAQSRLKEVVAPYLSRK
jgi:response regulator RpfG family c-di-GMP phosphodiesterase